MSKSDVPYVYEGSELEVFAQAVTWKAYFREQLAPFICGDVLEVGAGIGGTTDVLAPGSGASSWLCLEPDAAMAAHLRDRQAEGRLPEASEVWEGTVPDLEGRQFDTILYIDVLEHIADDRAEVMQASRLLAQGGHLIVLAPAHQWLFSPFDEAIGHFRRYDRGMLERLTPDDLSVARAMYLDSVGLLASLGNRLLLRAAHPSQRQIRFWDRVLVPVSRRLDPLLGNRAGRSVVVIWRRD